MPRFFIRGDQVDGNTVTIFGDDAHHISRSLRMAAGEHITVCDMQKNEYECVLTEFLPDCVHATVLSHTHSDTEPPYSVHLYQALPKGDKLDSIIQKAVECGVNEITTFESERCIVRVRDGGEEKKLERRQRIALEAAKQSGRGTVPAVYKTVSFEEAIKNAASADLPLFCYEGEDVRSIKSALQDAEIKGEISVIIGSEGGFSQREAEQLKEAGAISVGLGKRILRCETAPIFALSCIAYELELC